MSYHILTYHYHITWHHISHIICYHITYFNISFIITSYMFSNIFFLSESAPHWSRSCCILQHTVLQTISVACSSLQELASVSWMNPRDSALAVAIVLAAFLRSVPDSLVSVRAVCRGLLESSLRYSFPMRLCPLQTSLGRCLWSWIYRLRCLSLLFVPGVSICTRWLCPPSHPGCGRAPRLGAFPSRSCPSRPRRRLP